MDDMAIEADRRAAIRTFVRTTFGLRGTLRLHRFAFGADLLRAPANVFLAPVFLIIRLAALLASALRFRKTSVWMLRRKILLETNVSRQVAARTMAFIADLDARGLGGTVPYSVVEHEVAEYTGVRSAVGEITTTFFVLIAGYIMFQSATPGVISLVGPVAEMRAHSLAVAQFPLGQGLGRMYYGVISTDLSLWPLVATGFVLAMLASVVTTFAGVIVDPLQVMTGTHRRRLSRLLSRLEVDRRPNSGLASEHITARMADLTDMALNLWRVLRG
jgi:hypothetical protein